MCVGHHPAAGGGSAQHQGRDVPSPARVPGPAECKDGSGHWDRRLQVRATAQTASQTVISSALACNKRSHTLFYLLYLYSNIFMKNLNNAERIVLLLHVLLDFFIFSRYRTVQENPHIWCSNAANITKSFTSSPTFISSIFKIKLLFAVTYIPTFQDTQYVTKWWHFIISTHY